MRQFFRGTPFPCGIRFAVAAVLLATSVPGASAQKAYDKGATDSEIKVGNIMPYSGPASFYSAIGKTEAAYMRMVNEQGGVNGRKINFISYDDAYSPPRTVQQVRKLVENDEVLLVFNAFGTATNLAIQKYLNVMKVPQLFASSRASSFTDPAKYPWSMGWSPSFRNEGRIWASHILKNHPGSTIGVLLQNDDFGKDYVAGLREGLGDRADKMIVAQVSFDILTSSVDAQMMQIRAANPDIFLNIASPKFAAKAINKVAELGWKPVQLLVNGSQSPDLVAKATGAANMQDIVTAGYMKHPSDPRWRDDPAFKEWNAFMDRYYPDGDKSDIYNVYGYGIAKTLVDVLRRCGDTLTRDNVMKQAANLDIEIGIYLPGTKIKTSSSDYSPIEQLQMMRFKGERWEVFGPVLNGEKG